MIMCSTSKSYGIASFTDIHTPTNGFIYDKSPEIGRPERTENIRTMFASRELLSALSAIVDFCDDHNPDPNISLGLGLARLLPQARAAVALAKGKS
jgi:hypothetical protein